MGTEGMGLLRAPRGAVHRWAKRDRALRGALSKRKLSPALRVGTRLNPLVADFSRRTQKLNSQHRLAMYVAPKGSELIAPKTKSRLVKIPLQIHRAVRQAGAIKPVRRAGLEWAVSCAPAARSCVGGVYVRRRVFSQFPLALCCEGLIKSAPLTQRDRAQRTEVQYRVAVSGRPVSHLQYILSSPCRTPPRRTTRGRALKPPYRRGTFEELER